MNSIERHQIRYERRKKKRFLKQVVNNYTYEQVFSYSNLYNSYLKCLKNVKWKGTVQKYHQLSLAEVPKLRYELINKTIRTGNFYKFDICERGKIRHIQSVGIKERVLQKCLCDNYLVPMLSKNIIYDNSACQKGKGYHFAVNRIKRHLVDYFRKYNTNEGYVLRFDFSKYFDNISHSMLKATLKEVLLDNDLYNLTCKLIDDFDGDYGIGLGSQISQICALWYPRELDNKLISVKGAHSYSRYMDDGIIISNNYDTLVKCKNIIENICDKLEIKINSKKTIITKLSKGFTFIKARYTLLSNGKVIIKHNKNNITKNRRKLKRLKSEKDCEQLKTSVNGYLQHFNSHKTKLEFNKLYNQIIREKEKQKYD